LLRALFENSRFLVEFPSISGGRRLDGVRISLGGGNGVFHICSRIIERLCDLPAHILLTIFSAYTFVFSFPAM
jgi:hypothetical protein